VVITLAREVCAGALSIASRPDAFVFKCLQKGGKNTFRIPVRPSLLKNQPEMENHVEVRDDDAEAEIRNRATIRNFVTDSNPRFQRGFNADTGGDGSVGYEGYRCLCVCIWDLWQMHL
jgi:hypothetical protein